ncbi:hypothetical protein [Methylocystis sp.]|uniref:hypothetical protein n=1 Tax=Methylocystis sp. TaxID=1911079 RepID=UPI003DA4AEAB
MAVEGSDCGYFQPETSEASFVYWAKMPSWSEEEAAALLLGFNPDFISREASRTYGRAPRHITEYFSLCELTRRASGHRQIPYPQTPARWLAWAKKRDLVLLPKLEAEIVKWDGANGATVEADGKRVAELEARIAELTARGEARSSASTDNVPPVGARERETMLKIIIVMAVKGYAFDPKAKRGDSVKDIVADIEKCGLSLSDDTVRRYLREAADLLPPQEVREP